MWQLEMGSTAKYRIWGIWGSCYTISKAIFYLLNGGYRLLLPCVYLAAVISIPTVDGGDEIKLKGWKYGHPKP